MDSTIIRSPALRPSVIKRIRQNNVKYITHMQSVLAKKIYMEMYTKKRKRGDIVKNNMASVRPKNETVVLRMIFTNYFIEFIHEVYRYTNIYNSTVIINVIEFNSNYSLIDMFNLCM